MSKFTNYFNGKMRLFLVLFVAIFALGFTANAQAPYGEQYYNYGFEEWKNEGSDNIEPSHWHSFKSASGSYSSMMAKQIDYSSVIRPGSKGSRSARIWSRSVWTIVANGNMTTGRINAGAMKADDPKNYNYTQRNTDYCTPISSIPDSVAVWVCFKANSYDSKAAMQTVIHGDADFQQLGDGGYSPANMLCATANAEFTRTCASGSTEYVWMRLVKEFKAYPDVCTDCRYILTTFTTNAEPGKGSAGDEVYVDDICLIYNPTLSLGNVSKIEYMIPVDGSNVAIEVPFDLSGSMSVYNLNLKDNEVIAQLSDANGSFDNPIELGRVTTNESGTINGVIPAYVEEGTGYRVRVVSTNYPMTSGDNGTDIVITKEKAPLNPQIEVSLGYVSTNSIEVMFNPNEDCYRYFIYLTTAAEMEQAQAEMGASVEEVVKAKGMSKSGEIVYTWNDLQDDTEYKVYALPEDEESNNGELKYIDVKTDKAVDTGVSYISLQAQIVSSTSVKIKATPNEYTEVYHYIIIEKEIADEIGEIYTMIKVYEDENPLYVVDERVWEIETGVSYYAVASGRNIKEEWGEMSRIEFVAESCAPEMEVSVTVPAATSAVATITLNEHAVKYYAAAIAKAQYEEMEEVALVEYLLENADPNTSGGELVINGLEEDTDYCLAAICFNKYEEMGSVKVAEFTTKGVGLAELENDAFKVYPNPATEYVKVTSERNIEMLSVFSIDGKMVYSQNVNQQEAVIDLDGFNKGTYIVRIVSGGEVFVRRVVVE